ncbi:MAG: hypothetical protein MJ230_01120 [bacterium]|nr:hypothetical protein [bacterium]
MNIKKIAQWTAIGLLTIGTLHYCEKGRQGVNKRREYYKSEILKKDTIKYIELLDRNTKEYMSDVDWKRELKKINDSIKIDSMVRKAYYDGAQMVRDSITKVK